jgi:hypothetical protein
MTTTPTHTPTPWSYDMSAIYMVPACELELADASAIIASTIKIEDAPFIVAACNAYDSDKALIAELVDMMKRIAKAEGPHYFSGSVDKLIHRAEAQSR